MGLKCNAKHGVKAQLLSRFPDAFRKYSTLVDARDASNASREEAFACIDGNVLMMAVPKTCRTFDAYVGIVYSSLLRAIATAMVTVVVFDDPDSMTEAKKEEQKKRDSQRAATSVVCSEELQPPNNDDYTKELIMENQNVHDLKNCRGTRMRFYDEVAMTAMERLKVQISKWNNSGYPGGYVAMDGVDCRGASRGIGEKRVAGFVSSSDGLEEVFAREANIGEGDLKLAFLGRRVREMTTKESTEGLPCPVDVDAQTDAHKEHVGRLKRTKLTLCTTIDTDSFAIELLEEARRSGQSAASSANTLLCMRDRQNKRGRDEDAESCYLCCDVALLHELIQRYMFGISRNPSANDQRAAMSLMVAGWSLCGCDFVEVKGMRSDIVFDSMPKLIKKQEAILHKMQFAWAGQRDALVMIHEPIRDLLIECAHKLIDVRTQKKMDAIDNMMHPNDIVINRAAWVCAYWNSCEYKGNMSDFGFVSEAHAA